MAEYRLAPLAQRDLDGIFDYTVRHWGLAQAMHYAERIQATCEDLAGAPDKARDCAHIRAGYKQHRAEQHVIYFRLAEYGIAIIRILHQRMDAPRHL